MVEVLKFNVEEEIRNDDNIIDNILKIRGIEYPEKFLYPESFYDKELRTNPFDFHNIEKALKILNQSIEKYEMIGVLVDDDADGYSSAAALIYYIMELRESTSGIEWFFHKNKSHGLTDDIMEQMLNSNCDLLIIPDAGSNDFEQQLKLLEDNRKLIILDHHEVDEQSKIAEIEEMYKDTYALINNQLDLNGDVNKNFVGAGIVYKFCEAYDIKYKYNLSENIIDLVALGQISDASDISNYEIRYLVKTGLSNIKSLMMKQVLKGRIESGKVAPINLSFSIIPLINAVSRVGTLEEKDLILKSLMSYWLETEIIVVNKRRKNKITGKFEKLDLEWTMYQYVEDIVTKIKARQNKASDKIQKMLVTSSFTNTICIAITNQEDIKYRSITGLIANKLMSKFKMPTLVLVDNEDGTYSGSGRGYEKTFKDFRQWCLETGKFELAQGHDNAFGVIIKEDKLEELKIYLENMKDADANKEIVYDVDKLYKNETNIKEVTLVNENQDMFGGRVNPPVFGYEGLVLSRNGINQRGSVVTFFHKGLEFIAYKQEPGLADDFLQSLGFQQSFEIDLIGSPSRNEWNGRVKEQIILDDFALRKEIKTIEEKEEIKYIDNNGELSF